MGRQAPRLRSRRGGALVVAHRAQAPPVRREILVVYRSRWRSQIVRASVGTDQYSEWWDHCVKPGPLRVAAVSGPLDVLLVPAQRAGSPSRVRGPGTRPRLHRGRSRQPGESAGDLVRPGFRPTVLPSGGPASAPRAPTARNRCLPKSCILSRVQDLWVYRPQILGAG